MINVKLCVLLTLIFAPVVIVLVKQNKYIKTQINNLIQLKGWGYADIVQEEDFDAMYFDEKNWSRSEWGLAEAVISVVVACTLLLSGWKLTRYLHLYEVHIEQMVEKQVEKLSVEFKKKLIITLYSELENIKANIKEELSNDSKKQNEQTEMENKGIQNNLTCLKTSQVNYFPMGHHEQHINERTEQIHSYESQENCTSKAHDAEPDTEVIRFERYNMSECDDSCDTQIRLVDENYVKFTNLEIGDIIKAPLSYTVVCPLVVEEATSYLEESPDSHCQSKEISQPTINESAPNNESTQYSAMNSLAEESNKLPVNMPKNTKKTKKFFVTTVDENVEVLTDKNNYNKMGNAKNKHDQIASIALNNIIVLDEHTSTAINQYHQENKDSCKTSVNDTYSTSNSETKSKSSVKNSSIINRASNEYNVDNVPFICSINRSEETNNVKCITEGRGMGLELKEVATASKSYNPSRRIPQYQGLTKILKKQDNIERVGSLTNLSPVKAESMISRSGTPRHQYRSSPIRPESADTQALSANSRRKNQRITSTK